MIYDDKVRIVMVEDDLGHSKLIEKNLRRSGIMNDLVHFDNGRAVLEYFFSHQQNKDFHDRTLILLDLNLPEIDGFEVLESLKGDERTKKIPIIILTTTSNPKEIDRCYDLGCNIYITKPVDYQNFSEALSKLGMMLAVVKIPSAEGNS
ncbi:MAG: response regulator receiver protein [Alphaproteobacteria bacterium]|nr:response regulator receiver protein [Alphaproteobacteria bacterium]